jgi:hypothetical protein
MAMKALPTRLPEVTAEQEGGSAFAVARIGTQRFVLEDVRDLALHGGTVAGKIYFRGVAWPLEFRIARGKARLFNNALAGVLADG